MGPEAGTPGEEPLRRVPAGSAVLQELAAGERLVVVNTPGTQVVDCWAFVRDPEGGHAGEHMSMEHTRVELERVCPAVGDSLFSNRRRPVLTLVADTSPGVHDTTLAACDVHRYRRLGARGHHANCTDNLLAALASAGLRPDGVPCPFNLWENAPVRPDGTQRIRPPVSRPGDRVVLRAERDLRVVLSVCPQDLAPTNGAEGVPGDVHIAVEPARGAD
ncbi:urea carboxylase-associated family protein [Streptomyces sp. JJ36]|uniref:DUF1989 domain-containing protein n=1 Tax=Streptomyces sp. JJ36 TaxID=2736645 RepID=UPI001F46335B|nr:urea carboxylase-associated family protein [Streptomyces sp. JJ36]